METLKQFEIINKWQYSDLVHPLTCRKNKCEGILYPKTAGNDRKPYTSHIVLHCPFCNYTQMEIPDYVFSTNLDKLEEMWNSIFGEENEV